MDKNVENNAKVLPLSLRNRLNSNSIPVVVEASQPRADRQKTHHTCHASDDVDRNPTSKVQTTEKSLEGKPRVIMKVSHSPPCGDGRVALVRPKPTFTRPHPVDHDRVSDGSINESEDHESFHLCT